MTATATKTPTAEAIATAIRNCVKMWGNYEVRQYGSFYTVVHNTEWKTRSYGVETFEGHESCTCPQFAEEGVCKHQRFVAEHMEIEAQEEKEKQRADLEGVVYCNF